MKTNEADRRARCDEMASAAHLVQIRKKLMRWGGANFRNFAWRHEDNGWLTLVAEILLQRTRAEQAEQAFIQFSHRFPNYSALLSAEPSEVEDITRHLGIHDRADVIRDLASWIADHHGELPSTEKELREIRGIGPYTAAAWLSLHRNKRAVVIDANVYRWLGRMTNQSYGHDPRGVKWLYELAESLTPRRAFQSYNYAVLDFTIMICAPRNPRCASCPLLAYCCFGQHAVTA